MTILEALVRLRDDIKLWCTNNFNQKLNKNLGTEEGDKFLTTDESGNITTVDITATIDELNHVSGTTSNIQEQLDKKSNLGHTHTISNITNLQATLNAKAPASHSHTVADISDLTATATELNYMDGVTSNVQTQLNNINNTINEKADVSHTHTASEIGAAEESHTHSADDIKGVLSIANGGTGVDTIEKVKSNFGISQIENILFGDGTIGLEYTLGDYCYICSGIGTAKGEVVIPSSILYAPVTEIARSAFDSCTELTSVTIPDSVRSIGNDAFYHCEWLKSVFIAEGVKSIGQYAFSGCISLRSITIPDGVNTIDDYAFSNCTELTEVMIPRSVESIGDGAFEGCDNLMTVRYDGSSSGWSTISIGVNNSALTNADIIYRA